MTPTPEDMQRRLVVDLYDSPQWPVWLVQETLAKVKADMSPELVAKTLSEYNLYQENRKKDPVIRILSKHEMPFEPRKLTLLHYLVVSRQVDTIRFMLKNYPDIDLEVKSPELYINQHHVLGVTALWLATLIKDIALVTLLLEHGANPNTTNINGASPLRISAYDSQIKMVRLLLKFKADPNQVNNFNNTTLMLASYEGESNIVDLLLSSGADPNLAAYCGNTALHFAAEAGKKAMVEKLLKHGARFQKNVSGMTPLFTAAFYHHEQIVNVFVSRPNLVSLEDRIRAYELLGAGISLNKFFDFSQRQAEVFNYFRKAFQLRYDKADMQGASFDPKEMPRYPKQVLAERPEYGGVQETQTLVELESIETNTVRLLYESLFALVRFFGEKNLKTAEALTMIGARLIDHLRESLQGFEMWKRAIQIKINLKVFISEDLTRFVQGLYLHNVESTLSFWMDIIEYAIEYFEARPLPFGLQALAFQLNVYDLSQIEHFTLNDVKVESIISPFSSHCQHANMSEQKDIDKVLENVMNVVMVFARIYDSIGAQEKKSIRNMVGRFLKLNFTYTKCGRSLIHMIFVDQRIDNLDLDICPVLNMLYECGVNTNVFDDAYCTPLHYLAFYCRKNRKSVRTLATLYRNLVSHVYYGQYIRNALYHFDYGDVNAVHLDAVNIFNQTAFDIHPSLAICGHHPSLNLFPLKCLAARVCHSYYLRCGQCRYLSMYRFNDRMQYNLSLRKRATSVKDDGKKFYDMMINIKDHYDRLEDVMAYSLKYLYADHVPKKYEAKKIWTTIDRYSGKMGISAKLLEFIEMHGPCKFVHLMDQCDILNY